MQAKNFLAPCQLCVGLLVLTLAASLAAQTDENVGSIDAPSVTTTTIPAIADDWNIDRFSLLRDHLASITDESAGPFCKVTDFAWGSIRETRCPMWRSTLSRS